MDTGSGVAITGVLQHDAWLARATPPVERLATDLWSIPVPIPNSPLRYVSVYALADDAGLTLVDAGWNSAASWESLCQGLTSIGAAVTDVRGCLVTHQHYDHLGLASRIREASGAWVALHPADVQRPARHDLRHPERAARAHRAWLVKMGAPPEDVRRLMNSLADIDITTYPEADRLIEDGEMIGAPRWSLRAIHTPGHTPGHLTFFEESRGLLFSGDHVLPRISPHVPSEVESGADALGEYLTSLDKIAGLPASEVLPAHEWRFSGLAGRVRQLAEHHEQRLSQLLEIIRRSPGLVAWQLAGLLTWSRSWDQYDGFMRISAVDETMAHVTRLLAMGLIRATGDQAPRYFATAGGPGA
jgi:glyoxylase-like metal-dependent hydrolase (beta-lactamase superfamily II)